MHQSFYYELKVRDKRLALCVKTTNFHLRYLMARKMSDLAKKWDGNLIVRRLTIFVAITYNIKKKLGVFIKYE